MALICQTRSKSSKLHLKIKQYDNKRSLNIHIPILAPLSERLMDFFFLSISIHSRGKVYGQSNLSISVVLHQFLNVPIHCNVWSPVEAKFGLARLKEGKSKRVDCLIGGFTWETFFSLKSPLRACLLLFTDVWRLHFFHQPTPLTSTWSSLFASLLPSSFCLWPPFSSLKSTWS